MKPFLASLILVLCVSTASAWQYVPIEQSYSYNAYRGGAWGYGYRPAYRGYYGGGYGGGYAVPPLRMHSFSNTATGETWSGFSW